MKRTVKVIDAVMGSGKTTYAIQMMNGADEDARFLYITPYLSEVDRIIRDCPERNFVEPSVDGWNTTKSESLKSLVEAGRNIASTHQLFKLIDDDTAELIRIQGYTLVMDEVVEVVEAQNAARVEVKGMIESDVIRITEPVREGVNILKTTIGMQEGLIKYRKYRDMAASGRLVVVDGVALMWLLPANLLEIFEETYCMTYLFDGQMLKSYFDMFQIPYERFTLHNNRLCPYSMEMANAAALFSADLITIIEKGRINNIGGTKTALSKGWYRKDTKLKADQMRKNLTNFFFNCVDGRAEDHMWTVFKDFKDRLAGKGYAGGFISCNTRATNNYRHKKNLAYCCNMFLNPYVVKFFRYNGIEVDEDTYALSEMLQWVWRGAVREGNQIKLYVPSNRMRGLLKGWLEMVESIMDVQVKAA